ncbi:acyl-CoA dehydrogenase family protein [Arthrobacter sp. ISL-30]|uniref:acyl-CoA dehydrogenase family protein n=1 Tax=Arthrobacter sp. ISL-30 TaxID=2819109 RepID=UPI0027DEE8D3|nr:acyl-CoA dehydrogenase family protein [Arthrobacter sp. ISL-30]
MSNMSATIKSGLAESEIRQDLRNLIDGISERFPGEYWRKVDRAEEYPEEFVDALTESGCLGALVPEEYGGLGLGLGDASVILEQINANGGNAGPVHAQMYTMGLSCGTAVKNRSFDICRVSPRERLASRHLASPNQPPEQIQPASRRRQFATVTNT